MLRFDPTRSDHSKFVEEKRSKKRTKTKNDGDIPAKRSKTDDYEEANEPQIDEPPVSMEHFYEVRGDFQKSLGGGGFSLLGLFNRTADDGPVKNNTATDDRPYEEKLIAKNSVKFLNEFDPFNAESSDDEAGGKGELKTKVAKKTDDNGLKHESFFTLDSADPRITGLFPAFLLL